MYGFDVFGDFGIMLITLLMSWFVSKMNLVQKPIPRSTVNRHSSPAVPKQFIPSPSALPQPLPSSTPNCMNQFKALWTLNPGQLATAITTLDIQVLEPHMRAFHNLLVCRHQRLKLPDLARLMLAVAEKFSEQQKFTIRPMPRSQLTTSSWIVPALNKMSEQAVLLLDAMECSDVAVAAILARVCFLVLPWKKLLTNDIYKPFRKLLITLLTYTLRAADTRTKNSKITHTTQDLLYIHWTFSNIKFLSKNNAEKMRESLLTLAEGLEHCELMQATICEVST